MMNRRLLLSLAVVCMAGTLAGCELAVIGAGGAAITSAQDRRTTGAQVDDEGIELRASNHIGSRWGDKVHVNVTSYNRTVLLTGEVPDGTVKSEIGRLVLGLPNVRGAINELQIAGISSLPSRTNDAYITSKVKARFLDANRFNPIHVKVVTEAGVVYLLGIVTEQEAADAVEIARTTSGVRKVIKIFEYCKPTDEVCRPPAKAKS